MVGSSRRSKWGFTKSARARATRILQPPDISFVGFFIIVWLNPRPCKILPALVSNVLGSSSSSSSYVDSRARSSTSSAAVSSSIRASSLATFAFAEATIKSTALTSDGSASPRTRYISMWSGISTSRSEIDCKKVDYALMDSSSICMNDHSYLARSVFTQ